MSKLLLLIAIGVVVYVVMTGARKRHGRAGPPPAETMVPCAHCGVNLPRSEALEAAGRFYCSDEHRRIASG